MNIEIKQVSCDGPNSQTRLTEPVKIAVNSAVGQIKCPYLATIQFEPSDALSQVCTAPYEARRLPKGTNPLNLLPQPCRLSKACMVETADPTSHWSLEPTAFSSKLEMIQYP